MIKQFWYLLCFYLFIPNGHENEQTAFKLGMQEQTIAPALRNQSTGMP